MTIRRVLGIVWALAVWGVFLDGNAKDRPSPKNESGIVQLTILHTNDMQGQAFPYSLEDSPNIGGLAAIQTLVHQIRNQAKHSKHKHVVLVLDGGDFFHGTVENDILDGRPIISAMNTIRYDAAVLGTEDLLFGSKRLFHSSTKPQFHLLSANAVTRKTRNPLARPFVILKKQGIRIGILGLTSRSGFQKRSTDIRLLDPLATAAHYETVVAPSVDILIALTHLGVYPPPLEPPPDQVTDTMLAQRCRHVSVIVGGHSHTPLDQPILIRNKLIVQSGHRTQFLGRLDLFLDPQRHFRRAAYRYKLLPINIRQKGYSTVAPTQRPYLWKAILPDPRLTKLLSPLYTKAKVVLKSRKTLPTL